MEALGGIKMHIAGSRRAMKEEHFFKNDERNRLLEAIEQQAKSLSMARGSDQQRLSDWLNAAEEVMPEEVKKPAVKPMSLNNTDSKSNPAQIMGFLAVGTLLLAMVGGGSFAYMHLVQQVDALEKETKTITVHVGELEQALQESNKKIEKLEAVSIEGESLASNRDTPKQSESNSTHKSSLESILDDRFKQLIDALDSRVQNKEPVSNTTQALTMAPTSNASTHLPTPHLPTPAVVAAPIAAPIAATTPTVITPTVTTPAVPQIVEVKLTSSTSNTDSSSVNVEHEWLHSLASENLILQLGSNPKPEGLIAMAAKIHKNPEMAHVISVNANGSTRYILVYGAFATREEAKQASDEVKNDLAISPWLRRVVDVRALVDKR